MTLLSRGLGHLYVAVGLLSVAIVAEVTVSVANVEPLPLDTTRSVTSASELLLQSCPEEFPSNDNDDDESSSSQVQVVLSSFNQDDDSLFANGSMFPSSGSVVRGALESWAHHQHLVLRADEIWFEILAQLNFYVSAHAEGLRDVFIVGNSSSSGSGGNSHQTETKDTIRVSAFTWKDVLAGFGTEIQKRVKTEWLLEWILPGFSTSTESDTITATALMMGLTQHYFEFEGMIVCGIPSVTLLGVKHDWEHLLAKLDHLAAFGDEAEAYAIKLRPVLRRFVQTWDQPDGGEVRAFWEQIVRAHKVWSCGEGPYEWEASGWITAFLHWTHNGRLRIVVEGEWEEEEEEEEGLEVEEPIVSRDDGLVTLDNITYESVALMDITVGYAKAPLKMVEADGTETMAYLLAGNIGVKRTKTMKGVEVRPMSGWAVYVPPGEWNGTENHIFLGSGEELTGVAEGLEVCNMVDVGQNEL